MAIYSTFFTPMEFGFIRGLSKNLALVDVATQVFFLVDIVMQFLVAYRDSQTYNMVYKRKPIALRYACIGVSCFIGLFYTLDNRYHMLFAFKF